MHQRERCVIVHPRKFTIKCELCVIIHNKATLRLKLTLQVLQTSVTQGHDNAQGASVTVHVTDQLTAQITELPYLQSVIVHFTDDSTMQFTGLPYLWCVIVHVTDRGSFTGGSTHSTISMGTPIFSYKVSRSIHSVLNSSVTGFCFESKLRKTSDHRFFGRHEEKLEAFAKICVAASLETIRKDPTIRALQKSTTTGCLETTQRNLQNRPWNIFY